MKDECNEMNYEKCFSCSHSETYYRFLGGVIIICKITGKNIEITECVKKFK